MINITVTQREAREEDAVSVKHAFIEADFGVDKRTPTIFALWQMSRKFDLAVQHANVDLDADGSDVLPHTTESRFSARVSMPKTGNGGEVVETVELPQASAEEGEDFVDGFLDTIRKAIARVKEGGST